MKTEPEIWNNPRAWILGVAIILLDQGFKHLARQQFFPQTPIIENPSLPFGLDLPGFFNVFLVAGLLGLFLWVQIQYKAFSASTYGFFLVLSGAFSNLLDRLYKGTVTDFLNLGLSMGNFADMAIFLGIILLLWKHHFRKPAHSR